MIVVQEAQQPERDRHQEHDPDIAIGQIRPQQRRADPGDQDQQPAHGGRARLFHDVALRAVGADGLALALLHLQPADQRGRLT